MPHDDRFRARSEPVGGIRTPELQLDALADVLNRALAFYDAFMSGYDAQRSGYQANKVVLGRFTGDAPAPIELLAEPRPRALRVPIPARDKARRAAGPPLRFRHSSPRVPDSKGIGDDPRQSTLSAPTA